MDLYQEQLIDLAKNPLNRREISGATHTQSGVNVMCGDHVRMYLKIEGVGNAAIIRDSSWQGEGCAISVAAASLLTDQLNGMSVRQAVALQNETMFEWLGVPALGPARVKCAVLCLETMQQALEFP